MFININSIGIVSAIVTLFTIAVGHIMVREVEYRINQIQHAIIICILLGIGFGLASLTTVNKIISTVFGIMWITFLWDGLEFFRQQQRVIKGHAPANPDNPRHQKILSHYPSATTENLTDRDPRGYPYTDEEIRSILNPSDHKGEHSP